MQLIVKNTATNYKNVFAGRSAGLTFDSVINRGEKSFFSVKNPEP
ncbi:MAG: hypothetical protein R2791_09160 [Saprospiraceae bacterium]